MSADSVPTPPCPLTVLQTLREAAGQLETLTRRVEAYAADGDLAEIIDARRLARILSGTFNGAACDAIALANSALDGAELPSA